MNTRPINDFSIQGSGLEVGAIYIRIGGPNVEMGLNGTKKMALNRMRYRETPSSKRFGSSKLMAKSRFRFESLWFFMADSSYFITEGEGSERFSFNPEQSETMILLFRSPIEVTGFSPEIHI